MFSLWLYPRRRLRRRIFESNRQRQYLMDVQPATTVSVIPPFPVPADRATFTYNSKALAFGLHMGPPGPFVGEMNALSANVAHNAGAAKWFAQLSDESRASASALAAAAAVSAQNAAVSAGADRWVPGNYLNGDPVWSPISLLTYRRIPEGPSASAVDPANDPAGWRLTGSPHSMPQKEITTALDPDTGLPHLLSVGVHYLIKHALADCLMPAGAVTQEMVRVTNQSGASTPMLRKNGATFNGFDDDLQLDLSTWDKVFTKTATSGWI
ncbi:hypothetical protein ACIGHN_13345 [Acidovorax sp. NPDC077693]|uniref:hypothetical protein n=1 Tax=unclassified Acidovorax TaxID=2684926 RepID=UPI0037CA7B70